MPDLCGNGLHPKEPGPECRGCRRARQARYRQTEKGRATHRRSQNTYERTPKGQLSRVGRDIRALAERHVRALEELNGNQ